MPTSSWVHARSHQGLRHRDGQPERSPSPGFGDGNWMRDQPGWGPAWVGTRPALRSGPRTSAFALLRRQHGSHGNDFLL